ncbi:ABC transporter B family member 15-like [Amblyraja radiata]|uniref:ABC transporter B family member 15-like n=1 Tax=Amblyraja radiata TaxID=386614 RepID=UPI0014023541|nr:ABC transporter B family member 15-like [Amblyraja radiata]
MKLPDMLKSKTMDFLRLSISGSLPFSPLLRPRSNLRTLPETRMYLAVSELTNKNKTNGRQEVTVNVNNSNEVHEVRQIPCPESYNSETSGQYVTTSDITVMNTENLWVNTYGERQQQQVSDSKSSLFDANPVCHVYTVPMWCQLPEVAAVSSPQVALVGQETTLFALSVRDNIRYGLDHCPQADVAAAAQSASARDFIERMDQGFDTDVGEAGGQISAGQKQRIAIARALVRQPRILVLDEATSSLDTHTELSIQRALAREPVAAALVIAHRLKTVQRADRIVVLEGGRVVERGTHSQLMELGGCYSRMVLRQFTNGEQGAAVGE